MIRKWLLMVVACGFLAAGLIGCEEPATTTKKEPPKVTTKAPPKTETKAPAPKTETKIEKEKDE